MCADDEVRPRINLRLPDGMDAQGSIEKLLHADALTRVVLPCATSDACSCMTLQVWGVQPALHSPLMSVTNAISGAFHHRNTHQMLMPGSV